MNFLRHRHHGPRVGPPGSRVLPFPPVAAALPVAPAVVAPVPLPVAFPGADFLISPIALQGGMWVAAGGKTVRVQMAHGSIELVGPFGSRGFPSRRSAAQFLARLMTDWQRQYGSFTTNIPYAPVAAIVHLADAEDVGDPGAADLGDLGAKDAYGKYKEFVVESVIVRDYGHGELRIVTGGKPGAPVPKSTPQWYRLTNGIKAIKQGKLTKTLQDVAKVSAASSAILTQVGKKKRHHKRARDTSDEASVEAAPVTTTPAWLLPVGIAAGALVLVVVLAGSRKAA